MKSKKIIFVMLLVLTIVIFTFNISYAADSEDEEKSGSGLLDIYDGNVDDSTAGGGISEARKIIGRCITIVQVFGVFIAVAMCISLGIKYMYASPGDKAQIKNHLTVYVIGAVVMFGATGILQIIKAFYTGIEIS